MSTVKKSPKVTANIALYERIRSGDKSAINEMIEHNVGFAKSRVGNFLAAYRRFNYLQDDLVGEAYMTLVKVVNSFTNTTARKPMGRIGYEIDKSLGDFVDNEIGSGGMSTRTIQRRRTNQQPLPAKLPIDIGNPPAGLWFDADGRVIRKLIVSDSGGGSHKHDPDRTFEVTPITGVTTSDAKDVVRSISEPDKTPAADLLDEILACCECEEDEMIVHLRLKEYTDDEIGEQLGLSRQTVQLRRSEIEQRFEERK